MKEHGRITNADYREMFGVSNKTAYLELDDLVKRGILAKVGSGRTVHYVLGGNDWVMKK